MGTDPTSAFIYVTMHQEAFAKAEISEDEIKELEENLQKITDKYIKEVDAMTEEKSKEILTV